MAHQSSSLLDILGRVTLKTVRNIAIAIAIAYFTTRQLFRFYISPEHRYPRTRMVPSTYGDEARPAICDRKYDDLSIFVYSHRIARDPADPDPNSSKRAKMMRLIESGVLRFDIDISVSRGEFIVAHPAEISAAEASPGDGHDRLTLESFLLILSTKAPAGAITVEAKYSDYSLLRKMVDVIMASKFTGRVSLVANNNIFLQKFIEVARGDDAFVDRVGVAIAYRSQPFANPGAKPDPATSDIKESSLFSWKDRALIEEAVWKDSRSYGISIVHMPDLVSMRTDKVSDPASSPPSSLSLLSSHCP